MSIGFSICRFESAYLSFAQELPGSPKFLALLSTHPTLFVDPGPVLGRTGQVQTLGALTIRMYVDETSSIRACSLCWLLAR